MEMQRGVTSGIAPSGNGKSGLTRCSSMPEKSASGEIFVDDVQNTDKGCAAVRIRRRGRVFRHFKLFHHRRAMENVVAAPMDLPGL